ncbi:MAG: DHH family phosphoesterase [Patescibacteria group bacterium]
MLNEELVKNLQDLISSAQSILVIVSPKADRDQWSSAVALYSSLKTNGKDAMLCSPVLPNFDLAVDSSEIKTVMGNQNLVVSFDYNEAAVDKVSYHIGEESGKFYLTIKPKKGQKPLDTSGVEFSYSGAEADLAILVGVHDLESLDTLYFGYEALYQNTPLVCFHTFDPGLGGVVVDVSSQVCMSEVVCLLAEAAQMSIDADNATQLLSAIEEKTDGFRSLITTAETFEVVAKLMHKGARRIKRSEQNQAQEKLFENQSETTLIAGEAKELFDNMSGEVILDDESKEDFAEKLEMMTNSGKHEAKRGGSKTKQARVVG